MKKNNCKKRYLNDIWTLFPLHGKKEKEYLRFLEIQIDNSDIELNGSDYTVLSETLGSPQEIVSSFYEEVEFDYIIKKMKIRSLVKKIIICLNIMLLLFFIWQMSLIYMSYLKSNQDIIKYEEVLIEEN